MLRLIVILLISWVYVGCAPRGGDAQSVPRADPRIGGNLRIAVDAERVSRAVVTFGVTQPLLNSPDVATPLGELSAHCSRFRFNPPGRYPGGAVILAQDLIVELEERLRHRGSSASWLLAPVIGATDFVSGQRRSVSGLTAVGADLRVCTDGPAPDLALRMTHPDLLHTRTGADGRALGPGPFVEAADGALVANPDHVGPSSLMDRLERRVVADPELLVELGEADVALLYGKPRGRVTAAGSGTYQVQRTPAWDRRYALWLNPQARWLNDPRFRRWMADALKKPAMLDYLFDGEGSVLSSLLESSGTEPRVDPVPNRPVSRTSLPRFALSFAATDDAAESIAARIKATLRASRVEVTMVPMPRDELNRQMGLGQLQAAIISVEPFFDDPLLRLGEMCHRFGASSSDAMLILDQAASLAEPESRLAAALAAQDALIGDALVVPLLKVHAWLATRTGLTGVRSGPGRTLEFHEAGWSP